MQACTATQHSSFGNGGFRLAGNAVCLQCSIASNLCVSCIPPLRVPENLNAADVVCEANGRNVREETMRRKRILIVDNDEDVLIALERALEEEGYETVTAWDLPEGLELLSGTPDFDLLLIGDHPPELNCERVLKLLARRNVCVPCVVMHSTARHPFAEPYLRHLGAMGIACKWSEKEVLSEVERCFAPMPSVSAPAQASKAMAAAAGRH